VCNLVRLNDKFCTELGIGNQLKEVRINCR